MKLKILIFLTLFMLCTDSKAVSISDSEWLCESSYQVGEIQNVITDNINLKRNGTFEINTTISFVNAQEQLTSQLVGRVSGKYTYHQRSIIYDEISDIDINIINDDIGFLTSAAIDELEYMLNKSSGGNYKTVSLSSDRWVSVHSVSGEQLTCLSVNK